MLTGGSTPGRAYELAAEREPDWSRVALWWGDERCVPPDDERSNYGMAKRTLLDRLDDPARRSTACAASSARTKAPRDYDRELGDLARFDLVLLGLGPDGHVASLYPEPADARRVGATACSAPRRSSSRSSTASR